ncbi:MAG: hypothetical protein H6751_14040 [Candidatus Omnitrophica bacterium]|nr:hypothetical protein [Candidatus Omnitrophota bacterium]
MKRSWRIVLSLLLVLLVFIGYRLLFDKPPAYTLTDLGEIENEDFWMILNDRDQLLLYVRSLVDDKPVDRCQIWEQGKVIHSFDQARLGYPFRVYDFNDNGQIVGQIRKGEVNQGFRWAPEDGMTLFEVEYIASINDNGLMVGTATIGDSTEQQPCLIHSSGEVESLIDQLGDGSGPMRIDNSGRILTSLSPAQEGGRRYGVWWDEGITEIQIPEGSFINGNPDFPILMEMNETGAATGWTRTGKGFIWSIESGFSRLESDESVERQQAWDLNNQEEVVGAFILEMSGAIPFPKSLEKVWWIREKAIGGSRIAETAIGCMRSCGRKMKRFHSKGGRPKIRPDTPQRPNHQ